MLGRWPEIVGRAAEQSAPPLRVCRVLGDGLIPLGYGDTQCLTGGGVVLLGELRRVLDRHFRHIALAGENLHRHLASGDAQIIVADGEGGHAAAGADALLAGEHGNLAVADVVHNAGVVGDGVVRGDIEHIAVVSGSLGHGRHIIRVGEGILGAGETQRLQRGLHRVHLILAVGLGGAVQQAHGLGIGAPLGNHGSLLVQRGQVGRTGDIGTHGTVEIRDIQRLFKAYSNAIVKWYQ